MVFTLGSAKIDKNCATLWVTELTLATQSLHSAYKLVTLESEAAITFCLKMPSNDREIANFESARILRKEKKN